MEEKGKRINSSHPLPLSAIQPGPASVITQNRSFLHPSAGVLPLPKTERRFLQHTALPGKPSLLSQARPTVLFSPKNLVTHHSKSHSGPRGGCAHVRGLQGPSTSDPDIMEVQARIRDASMSLHPTAKPRSRLLSPLILVTIPPPWLPSFQPTPRSLPQQQLTGP